MTTRIAIVVVNFASADLIATNLVDLPERIEVVVVDNVSTGTERELVLGLGRTRGWTVVEARGNLGFGAGANLGVATALEAGAEVVCLLNPDAQIGPGDLDLLAARALSERDTLRAPRVVTEDGADWFTGAKIDLVAGRTPRADMGADGEGPFWLSGACLVFHADAWRLSGGFDPDFFLYWEDVDLSWRHVRAGGRLAYDGDVSVTHTVGGSQRDVRLAGRGRSPLYYFYNCRNRLLFAAKHLDPATRRRWLRTSPRYAREVVLRGGRRQLLRPWAPLSAVVRGTVAGTFSPRPGLKRVRVYRTVRTAHLERFAVLEPATVFYVGQRYDFDPGLLGGLDVRRVTSVREIVRALVGHDVEVLEINEPLMLSGLRTSLAAVAAVRVRGALRGRRTRVVAYAIENQDPFASGQRRARRRGPYRLAVNLLLSQVDRIAFGTDAARATYAPWLGRGRRADVETTVIPALATPCPLCRAVGEPDGVVFLGAFDDRKGVRELIEAWPQVRAAVPEARLRLLGTGPMEGWVREQVAAWPEVSVVVEPTREAIHQHLAHAQILALLSQPSATWREQVGLPITEALAHGCQIITTDQTGLAPWLAEHGHRVLPTICSPAEVAAALSTALTRPRSATDVLADLPGVDGRLAADHWLFGEAESMTGVG